jgi:formylglycine-generating enzyme required for sulfatase activity
VLEKAKGSNTKPQSPAALPDKGYVIINCKTPNASVTLNGAPAVANQQVAIPLGTDTSKQIEIRVSADGYSVETQSIRVSRGETKSVTVVLVAAPTAETPAELTVRSSTPGATLTLDGNPYKLGEATRIRIANAPLRLVVVKVDAKGYVSQTKEVKLQRGQKSEITLDLVLMPRAPVTSATVVVKVSAPGASVRVDGTPAAAGESVAVDLSDAIQKNITVDASAPGYAFQSKTVLISRGQQVEVPFSLEPLAPVTTATITIRSTTPRAKAIVDGRPVSIGIPRLLDIGSTSPKRVEIIVSAPGFMTQTGTMTLVPGQSSEASIDLTAMPPPAPRTTITVSSATPDATATIDNKAASLGVPVELDMNQNSSTVVIVTVSAPGYDPKTSRETVAVGQQATVILNLVRVQAVSTLTVLNVAADSTFTIGGTSCKTGTPFQIDLGKDETRVLSVTVAAPGYYSKTIQVSIARGESQRLPVQLEMLPPPQKEPEPKAGAVIVNSKDGAELVYVPSGEFTMGDDDIADNPRHLVTLTGYWIYSTPVTVAQYKRFCLLTGRSVPEPPFWGWRETNPMVNVRWDDANEYARWAGAALPTEAQWEKAARGTDSRKFPWGNTFDPNKLRCSTKKLSDIGSTSSVGKYIESPYGASDMAGNVFEWCQDWYDPTFWTSPESRVADPCNTNHGPQTARCARGGSYFFYEPLYFRTAYRGHTKPDSSEYYGQGFRCCIVGPAIPRDTKAKR